MVVYLVNKCYNILELACFNIISIVHKSLVCYHLAHQLSLVCFSTPNTVFTRIKSVEIRDFFQLSFLGPVQIPCKQLKKP
jgi:hypothetical protein